MPFFSFSPRRDLATKIHFYQSIFDFVLHKHLFQNVLILAQNFPKNVVGEENTIRVEESKVFADLP